MLHLTRFVSSNRFLSELSITYIWNKKKEKKDVRKWLMAGIEYRKSAHASFRTYQHICVLKIVPPVGPDLTLTSNIPNIQFEAS